MNSDVSCPICRQSLTRVGDFWICPQHGEIRPNKSFARLRIFLSYGHDTNEELVLLIKADLERRGHDVWFDKSEIRFGDDWRRSITDGIVASHRVMSFLSKHSTRDPGVCLDELAIAVGVKGGNIQTILVESEQEVKPPPSIGHIQWLDMHDWKQLRAAGGSVWQDWYEAKLAEIVRVIESDESRRFAGEIEVLNGYLKPISSDSRVAALLRKGFVGREWLTESVDQWRNAADRTSRLFWITGDPGVGKSAFVAQLTHFGRDKVVAAQFVEWDKPDHRDARRVVRSLAFQLATRLPDYRKLLLSLPEIAELDRKDPAELFDYLLATPLSSVIGGGREGCLIVIDALDEAGEAGRNPLVDMLARDASRLPDWLGLVVTSRPESAVKTPLQGLNPFILDTRTDANRADLRDYVRHELAPQFKDRADTDKLVEHILEISEGLFLYVERFCDDVRHGYLSLDRPEKFPQGLGGIFFQWFQRQFPDLENFRKHVRPALRAVLAAREPLPVYILSRLLNWQEEEFRDFARTLGSLFPVVTEAPAHTEHYDIERSLFYVASRASREEVMKPYHKSLAEWLADESSAGAYFVSVLEGHRMLADFGWQEFVQQPRSMSSYSISHLPHHLIVNKDIARLSAVVNDHWFWEYSHVFYREDFYAEVTNLLTPSKAISELAPSQTFFADQASAKSPERLGFTLFPHEPGVRFDNGTQCDGYMIPNGAVEPPSDVLWAFIRSCDSAYEASSSFLRGARCPAVSDWYRNYWKSSGLQDTLIAIDTYYDTHLAHLAYEASSLAYRIDKALENASATQN